MIFPSFLGQLVLGFGQVHLIDAGCSELWWNLFPVAGSPLTEMPAPRGKGGRDCSSLEIFASVPVAILSPICIWATILSVDQTSKQIRNLARIPFLCASSCEVLFHKWAILEVFPCKILSFFKKAFYGWWRGCPASLQELKTETFGYLNNRILRDHPF